MKNAKAGSIAYYISAHGYGHGVRSCQIIRALRRLHPQLLIHIASDLPFSFLKHQIGGFQTPPRAVAFDVGMVQRDSIRVDVGATLEKVRRLYARRKDRIAKEAAYLREMDIRAIVVDIPALPVEAAAVLGVPSLAVGNFSWDWIYSDFVERDSRWQEIVDVLREEYAQTDLLLRLPFSGGMNAFPRVRDIPLTASPGYSRRARIADLTGCSENKKWVLLSFTALEWNGDALDSVGKIRDCEFFTVRPLIWEKSRIHSLDRAQISFVDILASMDVVVSKPGFGILSDCIVNKKPLIYADRSDFLEYGILEAAIKKYLRFVHIPASDLYCGDLSASLHRIWESPLPKESLEQGGDIIAADAIAGMTGSPLQGPDPVKID